MLSSRSSTRETFAGTGGIGQAGTGFSPSARRTGCSAVGPGDGVVQVERRVESGGSLGCGCVRPDSPRGGWRAARSGAPAGGGRRRSAVQAGRLRGRGRRGARRRRASRAWRHGSGGAAGGSPAGASQGSLAAPPARRSGAEHEALGQRVGGQPVGAVQAGAGALADRVEPGHRRARRRGRRRSRPCRSARPGPPARARWPGRGPPRAARRRRWGTAAGSTARMSRSTLGRPLSVIFDHDRARHLVARRELVDEALAVDVQQRRARARRIASAMRNPSRPLIPVDCGWMKLHELEVGQVSADLLSQHQPDALGLPGASSEAPARPIRLWRGCRVHWLGRRGRPRRPRADAAPVVRPQPRHARAPSRISRSRGRARPRWR